MSLTREAVVAEKCECVRCVTCGGTGRINVDHRLQSIENRSPNSLKPMSHLTQEEDGWRCDACGYFHRLDRSYDKPPAACEDCKAVFPETGAGSVGHSTPEATF